MTAAVEPRTIPDNPQLRERVLRCYKPNCRYLRSATSTVHDGRIRLTAAFEIGESCYIDDTGHLNAVEVNICYNQMLYLAVATCVREKIGPVFDTWSMEDFWRRQLPAILIARMRSTFTRGLDPRGFSGEFRMDDVAARRLRPDTGPLVSLGTSFRYWDSDGDGCQGTVAVAIVPDPVVPDPVVARRQP
ncbi:FcoT family thioesterase [Frankia sp. AgPm24]|uniref:FcoT family thioesterase n=1 Tax=Frankia sp. AgPm24 TaxID=631128 RepID=UPI00200DA1FC|nr:FcoT family thioesterase [Frankia sp. AgPm24]MCK9923355.1 FcoT family thioesterase [Frankia sp. AgPm24]